MKLIVLILLLICTTNAFKINKERTFNKIDIETLVNDSTLNIRALEIVTSKFSAPVYLSSKGDFGIVLPNSAFNHVDSLKDKSYFHHRINLSSDTLKLNFRALAVRNNNGFGITIGSPALLYKLNADLEKNKIVYQDHHPNAFYDSMEFWNDNEGIAIGDSTDECLSIIITRDGGKTWTKLNCNVLPKGLENEGAFAASDTNIAIVDDHTWVATSAGRVYYSPDKGETWTASNTPKVNEKETEEFIPLIFMML